MASCLLSLKYTVTPFLIFLLPKIYMRPSLLKAPFLIAKESSTPAATQEIGFPSGSNWGVPQLEKLNFPLQPEVHPFEDLYWERDLSEESLIVLNQLKLGFGVHEEEWLKGNVDALYKEFYGDLAVMLPQVKEKNLTPRTPAVRSNTKLPSSSVHQSSSPWTLESRKRPAPLSAERSTSKYLSSVEIRPVSDGGSVQDESDLEDTPTPTPKRLRDGFTKSPSLPGRMPTAMSDATTGVLHNTEISSSQTDPTYQASEPTNSISDDERSEGDRPEITVTLLIYSLLKVICEAHGKCNGYSFSVGNDVETFVIPICGAFPKSVPDLIVRMHQGKKTYSILDYEGKRLNMKMTKEGKFGQEVAHLLGRGNLMKATTVSDKYDVFLISTHNTKVCISTCEIQNEYLHRRQTKLPRSTSVRQVVHQYGPVDLLNTEQRVLAVSTIYRIMLEQAAYYAKPG